MSTVIVNPLTKEFFDKTDALIKHINSLSDFKMWNGEILIAKPLPAEKTKGGLVLTEEYTRRENYFNGTGRVLKMPETSFSTTFGTLETPAIKQGDVVLFNYAHRHKPNPAAMNFLLEENAEDLDAFAKANDYEHADFGILFIITAAEVKLSRDSELLRKSI